MAIPALAPIVAIDGNPTRSTGAISGQFAIIATIGANERAQHVQSDTIKVFQHVINGRDPNEDSR